MSKPCEGITLKPLTGAELVQSAAPKEPTSKYVAPWMRKAEPNEEKKVLSAQDLASAEMFPALKPMQVGAGKGASWAEISKRLAQPANLKGVVENAIERRRLEEEEGVRQEQETDPFKMTKAQLEKQGWASIKIPKGRGGYFSSYMTDSPPGDEEIYPVHEWGPSPFTEEGMKNPDLFMERFQCLNPDGTLVERSRRPRYRF